MSIASASNDDHGGSGAERSSAATLWFLEDDPDFASEMGDYLESYGYRVRHFDTVDALMLALTGPVKPDGLIVDQFVRSVDTIPFLPRMGALFSGALLVLTGNTQELDRVLGLELGCDDFLSKTLPPREILARIRAVIRRAGRAEAAPVAPAAPVVSAAEAQAAASGGEGSGWRLDTKAYDVVGPDGQKLGLTSMQFQLLNMLQQRVGQPVPREELHFQLTGRRLEPSNRNVDVLMSQLRHKLRVIDENSCQIRAIRNSGYLFTGFPVA